MINNDIFYITQVQQRYFIANCQNFSATGTAVARS
jgi:hypothetical protein